MSCKIIYNNQNYTIESFKDFLVTNKNLFLQDFISQDIEGFKSFVGKNNFDEENNLLRALPLNNINYQFKAIDRILDNKKRVESLWNTIKEKELFWNKIQKELQIPKEQINLLRLSEGESIEEKLASFAANYSYTVEINTAKEIDSSKTQDNNFSVNGNNYELKYKPETGNTYFKNNKEITEDEFIQANNKYIKSKPTQHYSNLTVPGGINYTENEIATPAITPSIKGHAQFATENGIGWFRSDDVQTKDDLQRELYTQNFTFEELLQRGEIKQVPCG